MTQRLSIACIFVSQYVSGGFISFVAGNLVAQLIMKLESSTFYSLKKIALRRKNKFRMENVVNKYS